MSIIIRDIGNPKDHGLYTLKLHLAFANDPSVVITEYDFDIEVQLVDECRGIDDEVYDWNPTLLLPTLDPLIYLYSMIGNGQETYDFEDFPDRRSSNKLSANGYEACGPRVYNLYDLD